ncbi:MAG: (Fe-S)-binding protein, partial [Gammaproteobacteria bacterium]|nr:(Fe-S)-binding protein [Gammaproteobacteria bacterium]
MYKPDLSAADLCVMCGMCQPHCPTYRADHIEPESPRGRVSLILGLWQQQLQADDSVIRHIHHCTGCGACEAICPSRVPIIQLMDNSKVLFPKRNLVLKTLLFLVRYPARYRLLAFFLRSQRIGALLRASGLLAKESKPLQSSIKDTPTTPALETFYPAKSTIQGNIGLFTGCISQLFDKKTLHDSITLLTHCGYNIHVSRQQACCGALHQHNGRPDEAQLLAAQNQQVFQTKALDAVISTSTGCTAQLKTSLQSIAVFDLMQFINEHNLLEQLELQPLKGKVLIHEPCSQRNQLKLPAIVPLMQQIPGLVFAELSENKFCCGAGGVNMLLDTPLANTLRQNKISDIDNQSADYVVTTNYGCALHLASGSIELSQRKQTEFCHPVSLLVRSASLQ